MTRTFNHGQKVENKLSGFKGVALTTRTLINSDGEPTEMLTARMETNLGSKIVELPASMFKGD